MSYGIYRQSSLSRLVAAIVGVTKGASDPAAVTSLLPAVVGHLYRFLNYAVAW